MEKLQVTFASLQNALHTFSSSFVTAQEAKQNYPQFILATQDSMIQRFEYSYDSFWKFLKLFLETKLQRNPDDVKSPKSVFRICVKLNICSLEEGETLLKMSDDRNITTHSYNIENVYKILPDLPEYYKIMKNIINKIENQL